jgi:transposase InsO family protein
MAEKEAKARIKINKLLEESGWRFFDNSEGEIFYTLKEAKTLIEKWRMEYNTFRPHSSLNYRPPAPEAYLN